MAGHRRNINHMWSMKDVCRLLDVHVNTVRRWTNTGLLMAHRVGPRGDRRFYQEDIVEFLIERRLRNDKRSRETSEVN